MIADREQRVRQRAHEIWQTEGCPEGRAEEHWERADQEIAAEDAAAPSAEDVAAPVADVAPAAVEVAVSVAEMAPAKPKAKPRAAKPAAAKKPAAKAKTTV